MDYLFARVSLLSGVLLLASCGSSTIDGANSGSTSTSQAVSPETSFVPEPWEALRASEQHLLGARAVLEAGRARWERAGHTTYTFTVWFETLSTLRVEVVDGVPVSEEVIQAPGSAVGDVDMLPRTVEEAFDEIDGLIAAAENDPTLVLPPGECGYHFNVSFGDVIGAPLYYDTLGPCDDGVGVRMSVALPE